MSDNNVDSYLKSLNIKSGGEKSTLSSEVIERSRRGKPSENLGFRSDRVFENVPETPNVLFIEYIGINTVSGGKLNNPISQGPTRLYVYGRSYFDEYVQANTLKITDIRNYEPSISSYDQYLIDDVFNGRQVAYNKHEFISIDVQPYLAGKIGFVGINNYTSIYSRPELWREIDGGPESPYTVTDIESVKHFVAIPPDEKRISIGVSESSINREYGFYFRHYDTESYWMNDPEPLWHSNTFLSENSYGFYYGKIPDGRDKKNGASGILDLNENSRYGLYNSDGRWGIYIDDEVSNYIEGRILVGHNIGIGTGTLPSQKEPIVSIFNNKYKDPDVLNIEEEFQIGLFVEDTISVGTRIDTRYRLNVDASLTSAGILANSVEKAAKFVGEVEVTGGNLNVGIDTSTGIVLTSPNGTKYRLIVDDAGLLTTVPHP